MRIILSVAMIIAAVTLSSCSVTNQRTRDLRYKAHDATVDILDEAAKDTDTLISTIVDMDRQERNTELYNRYQDNISKVSTPQEGAKQTFDYIQGLSVIEKDSQERYANWSFITQKILLGKQGTVADYEMSAYADEASKRQWREVFSDGYIVQEALGLLDMAMEKIKADQQKELEEAIKKAEKKAKEEPKDDVELEVPPSGIPEQPEIPTAS